MNVTRIEVKVDYQPARWSTESKVAAGFFALTFLALGAAFALKYVPQFALKSQMPFQATLIGSGGLGTAGLISSCVHCHRRWGWFDDIKAAREAEIIKTNPIYINGALLCPSDEFLIGHGLRRETLYTPGFAPDEEYQNQMTVLFENRLADLVGRDSENYRRFYWFLSGESLAPVMAEVQKLHGEAFNVRAPTYFKLDTQALTLAICRTFALENQSFIPTMTTIDIQSGRTNLEIFPPTLERPDYRRPLAPGSPGPNTPLLPSAEGSAQGLLPGEVNQ